MVKCILISGNLSKVRGDLIKSPDEDLRRQKQKEFAELAMDSNVGRFVDYFKFHCKTEPLERNGISCPERPFTEAEFSDPPQDTEQTVFKALRNLPQRLACSPAFWASYHLGIIESDIIKPSYMAKGQIGKSGQGRIEKALGSYGKKPLDDCVRTILRRMGGLPEARGSVSVFQDCRTARAWWRGFFADEVCRELGTDEDKVWKALRTNQVWEQLTGYVVQKLTVLGDTRIRIPLIAYVADTDPVPNDRETIQNILNRIGQRTAYQMMGVLSPRENLEIIKDICS